MSTAVPQPTRPYADAARSALAGLIDYAGLFPPAQLSMRRAVADYLAARSGEHAWMLGRFLCHASRLDELADRIGGKWAGRPFQVRVISDGDPAGDVGRALDFVARMVLEPDSSAEPRPVSQPPPLAAGGFDMFEVRWDAGSLDDLLDIVFAISYVIPVIEVPLDRDVDRAIAAIDAARQARGKLILAKLRCGGLTTDAFPSAEQVARFVAACSRAGLPFKATAGLHQPFRHVDPATGFTRHGFVNLMAAAVLGRLHGLDVGMLARVIDDRDPANFTLDQRVLAWEGYAATPEQISEVHGESLVAYGSCDFAEPVDALTEAGILPVREPPPLPDDVPGPVY